MAIIKMISNKNQSNGGMKFLLAYATDRKKTEMENGRILVSGINCSPSFAYNEFLLTKSEYHKTDGRMYYHCIQSFSPDENVSPEEVHKIGVELAEYFKGHEVVIGTHIEKEHLHNHLIINSVNCENGKKLHLNGQSISELMAFSDKICKEHGLSVLPPFEKKKMKGMSYGEYVTARNGRSWKFKLMNDIESAMNISHTKEEFIYCMNSLGYDVSWTQSRKYICYTTPQGNKCRDNKLHEDKFLKESMENEFEYRRIKETQSKSNRFDSPDGGTYGNEPQDGFDFEGTAKSNAEDYFGTERENKFADELHYHTGWEYSRQHLYGSRKTDEETVHKHFQNNASRDYQPDYNNSIGKGVLSVVKSLLKLKRDYDEDDTMALSIMTGLAVASVYTLIEIIKSTSEDELTEEFIEETIDELRENEQEMGEIKF